MSSSERPRFPLADAAAGNEQHGRDLAKVKDDLRALVESLRVQHERMREPRPAPQAPPPPPGPAASVPDLERRRLAAELALAQEALEHARAERERLRQRLAEIQEDQARSCDAYVAVQERTSEIANLYVTVERLHAGLTRGEVLTAIQEVVINLVGSEEHAVFLAEGGALVPAQSFGVEPGRLTKVAPGAGAIGHAFAENRPFFAGRSAEAAPDDPELTACIPLRAGDRVVGVLAIWRLLPHKPQLGDADVALLELLSAHAGVALHLRSPPEA